MDERWTILSCWWSLFHCRQALLSKVLSSSRCHRPSATITDLCSQHFQYCFGRAVFIIYHTFIYSLIANIFWAGTLEIAKWANHRWAHSPNEDLGLQSATLQSSGIGKDKDLCKLMVFLRAVNEGSWGKMSSKVIWVESWTTSEVLQVYGKERQPIPTRKSPPIFVFFCFS